MAKKWDTPTDGISRKQFDRAMDSHIRRYAILSGEVMGFEKRIRRLERLALGKLAEEE